MKAKHQRLQLEQELGFIKAFRVQSNQFGFHWHYHDEIEITYVIHGHGTRWVGDSIEEFHAGDFVLMGSNLPHTWISDQAFNLSSQVMEVVVLHIHPKLFELSESLPQFRDIFKLLDLSNRGIDFTSHIIERDISMLLNLIDTSGVEQYVLLLQLLDSLGLKNNPKQLAQKGYLAPTSKASEGRIQEVFEFLHSSYTDTITLSEVSDRAHMNKSAFCRFFKKSTGHTFLSYLNNLRISHACNLLVSQRQTTIRNIWMESGFPNQATFNKVFSEKMGCTPKYYRSQY